MQKSIWTSLLAYSALLMCPLVASADLVLHYEGESNALDSSGHNNHGTIQGGSYTNGMIGEAFLFNGNNQFVQGPVVPEINTGAFTIAMWMNANAGGGLRLVADSSHGGTRNGDINWQGFALQLQSDNRLDFAWGNGITFPHLTTNDVVADNTYHHIAATFDGTQMSLFVDGELNATGAYSGTAEVSARNFRLARHDQLGRQFIGQLDDVRIYDEILSNGQIANLAGVPEPTSGTVIFAATLVLMTRRRRIAS